MVGGGGRQRPRHGTLARPEKRREVAQVRSMERVAGLDWAVRSAVELSPMVLDTVDDVAR